MASATKIMTRQIRMNAKERATRSLRLKVSAYNNSEKAVIAIPAVSSSFSPRKPAVNIDIIDHPKSISTNLSYNLTAKSVEEQIIFTKGACQIRGQAATHPDLGRKLRCCAQSKALRTTPQTPTAPEQTCTLTKCVSDPLCICCTPGSSEVTGGQADLPKNKAISRFA